MDKSRAPATCKRAGRARISEIAYDRRLSGAEHLPRIGELHIANQSGSSGEYVSQYNADNVLAVGFSENGTNWSGDGNVSLGNSIGSGGGFTHQGGYTEYVHEHVYYEEIEYAGTVCGSYVTQATSSVGDAGPAGVTAPVNPYGSCHADPNGIADVPPGGFWSSDRSASMCFDATAWLGFEFTGTNGYSNDVHLQWSTAKGASQTYVCGNRDPVQNSGVFWNDLN